MKKEVKGFAKPARQTHECAASLGMVFRHNFLIVFAIMQMMFAYFFHSSTHIYVFQDIHSVLQHFFQELYRIKANYKTFLSEG